MGEIRATTAPLISDQEDSVTTLTITSVTIPRSDVFDRFLPDEISNERHKVGVLANIVQSRKAERESQVDLNRLPLKNSETSLIRRMSNNKPCMLWPFTGEVWELNVPIESKW